MIQEGIETITGLPIIEKAADKLDKIVVFVHSKTELFASIIQNIHKEIQILLQELGHEIGTYELVVSTTGIEMPLYTKRHFEIAIGETIVLELSEPLGSSNLYKANGLLSGVNEIGIEIDVDNKLIGIGPKMFREFCKKPQYNIIPEKDLEKNLEISARWTNNRH